MRIKATRERRKNPGRFMFVAVLATVIAVALGACGDDGDEREAALSAGDASAACEEASQALAAAQKKLNAAKKGLKKNPDSRKARKKLAKAKSRVRSATVQALDACAPPTPEPSELPQAPSPGGYAPPHPGPPPPPPF